MLAGPRSRCRHYLLCFASFCHPFSCVSSLSLSLSPSFAPIIPPPSQFLFSSHLTFFFLSSPLFFPPSISVCPLLSSFLFLPPSISVCLSFLLSALVPSHKLVPVLSSLARFSNTSSLYLTSPGYPIFVRIFPRYTCLLFSAPLLSISSPLLALSTRLPFCDRVCCTSQRGSTHLPALLWQRVGCSAPLQHRGSGQAPHPAHIRHLQHSRPFHRDPRLLFRSGGATHRLRHALQRRPP